MSVDHLIFLWSKFIQKQPGKVRYWRTRRWRTLTPEHTDTRAHRR